MPHFAVYNAKLVQCAITDIADSDDMLRRKHLQHITHKRNTNLKLTFERLTIGERLRIKMWMKRKAAPNHRHRTDILQRLPHNRRAFHDPRRARRRRRAPRAAGGAQSRGLRARRRAPRAGRLARRRREARVTTTGPARPVPPVPGRSRDGPGADVAPPRAVWSTPGQRAARGRRAAGREADR